MKTHYTPKEAAKIKDCSLEAILKQLREGKIPGAEKVEKEIKVIRWLIPKSSMKSIVVRKRVDKPKLRTVKNESK